MGRQNSKRLGEQETINKNIIAIAALALLATNSIATAGDVVDFDGMRSGRAESFTALLQKSAQANSTTLPVPVTSKEMIDLKSNNQVEIRVAMKSGKIKTEDTLVCKGEKDTVILKDCKKQSGLADLTKSDAEKLMLQRFFPGEFAGFTPIANRHAYCNQSGPEFFNCTDKHVDPNWIAKGRKTKFITECNGKTAWSWSGYPSISGGIDCSYRTEEEIDWVNEPYWTHECEQVDNC